MGVVSEKRAYEDLANAIVAQAAADYREELAGAQIYKRSTTRARRIRRLETFFRSHWFDTLTGLDGEELMMLIREEIRHDQ